MANKSLRLNGVGELRRRLQRKAEAMQKSVEPTLHQVGLTISTTAKMSVQKAPRGGRWYQLYKPRRKHKASAPGESPATDTGMLASSITYRVLPREAAVEIKAGKSIAPYAYTLEYGSSDGKLKARPFMRPAFEKHREWAVALIRAAVRKAIETE